ncbi:unnamed protein product [Ceutorhynchus assimilis]|uniref:Uncharacterized protein n=1 Tax=Ceutorhynchus assimilis TaxID=467358 RepID=A0A9N9MZG8_9CUCU|nr:unnamed protein product [Ceutorhynchus assimilis]
MFPRDLAGHIQLEKLKPDRHFSDEIRHIKCPIIKLVKRQIENSDNVFCVRAARNKSLSQQIWKHRWTIVQWLVVFLVMVCLFFFGAMLGAGICSCNLSQHSLPCTGMFSFFPGFNIARTRTFIY